MQDRALVYLKKFNALADLFVAAALAIVTIFAVGLFVYDVYMLVSGQKALDEGILTVLGSLLILWASIELIHEEIKHLQGKDFEIGAFIMLAMAALIRKILIYSLSSEKSEELIIIGGVLVGLALAYWLIELANRKKYLARDAGEVKV